MIELGTPVPFDDATTSQGSHKVFVAGSTAMVHHSAAGDESQELVERQAAAAVGPWRGRLWRSWRGRIRLPSTSELDPTNNNTSKTCMHDPNLTTTRIPHRTHAVLLAPRRLLVHQKVHVAVPAPSVVTRITLYVNFVFRDNHPNFLKAEIPELPIEERPSSRTCLCESRNIGRAQATTPEAYRSILRGIRFQMLDAR